MLFFSQYFFSLIYIYLFVAVLGLHCYSGLPLTVVSGGFSLQWLLLLHSSVSTACGLSSCGALAQLLCGMQDLPGSGIEPVSPALTGRFFTTEPPGKSNEMLFQILVLKFTTILYKLIKKNNNKIKSCLTSTSCFILIFSFFRETQCCSVSAFSKRRASRRSVKACFGIGQFV